jgi:regulatory protein
MELAQHGLKLGAQPLQQLRDSELQRAASLWQRRFGTLPSDERERARQARFLAGRGFSGEAIRRVLSGIPVPPADEPLPD